MTVFIDGAVLYASQLNAIEAEIATAAAAAAAAQATADAAGTNAFIAAGTGAATRTLQDKGRDGAVSVRDFAANLAELTTNAKAATNLAIAAAYASGARAVYFPALPGGAAYLFPLLNGRIDPGVGDMDFVGDGMHSTILKFQEGSSTTQGSTNFNALFFNVGGSPTTIRGRLSFRDMQFQGTLLDVGGSVNTGGPALCLNSYESVTIDRCRFYGLGWMAMQNEYIHNVRVTNCEFEAVMRDQVRFRSSFNVLVDGNSFKNSDDDSVALHASSSQGAGVVRENIVITNNVFEDTTGIVVLGGRMVTVANNTGRRMKLSFINVATAAGEADNPMYGVKIVGNQAFDVLDRSTSVSFAGAAQRVFSVVAQLPRVGSADTNIQPGSLNGATGGVVPPWNYFLNEIADATLAIPPGYAMEISGNTVMRTLPAVAAYSDWGFGQTMTATGFANPAVTEANLKPVAAITLGLNIVGLKVHGNTLMNCQRGISISNNLVRADLLQGEIADNHIYDCWEWGVILLGSLTGKPANIRIRNNTFDLDPYRVSLGRNANGSWTSAYANSAGIYSSSTGLVVEGNVFANCYKPTITLVSPVVIGNTVRGQIAALGYDAANFGIGDFPTPGAGYRIEWVRADSTDAATYGNILQAPAYESAAQPTTGSYVKGHFVRCTSPEVARVYGWLRLVTGSAHVALVDWLQIGDGLVSTLRVAMADGGTATALDDTRNLFLTANVGITGFTVNFPPTPLDGQRFSVSANIAVASVVCASASTIDGPVTALGATTPAAWVWNAGGTRWMRV